MDTATLDELVEVYRAARPGSMFDYGLPSCAESDPEAWFPEQGGYVGVSAKRICQGSDLWSECLADEINNSGGRDAGIKGAATHLERRALRKRLGIAEAEPDDGEAT